MDNVFTDMLKVWVDGEKKKYSNVFLYKYLLVGFSFVWVLMMLLFWLGVERGIVGVVGLGISVLVLVGFGDFLFRDAYRLDKLMKQVNKMFDDAVLLAGFSYVSLPVRADEVLHVLSDKQVYVVNGVSVEVEGKQKLVDLVFRKKQNEQVTVEIIKGYDSVGFDARNI